VESTGATESSWTRAEISHLQELQAFLNTMIPHQGEVLVNIIVIFCIFIHRAKILACTAVLKFKTTKTQKSTILLGYFQVCW
jgi:uncharacterized protein YhhL (DUF1145 family)